MNDVSELRALSRDIGKTTAAAAALVYSAVSASAQDVQKTWRETAKVDANKAARRYPDSIVTHPKVGTTIGFEVYPDERVNGQAKLASILEDGSPTSPPHLWADRAVEAVRPRHDKRIAEALAGIAAVIETGATKSQYTTRSGKTIMASDAQIAHWTRGS